jgi:hypothetical protein
MSAQLFVFIQFEFPWELGPADGRYLLRRDGDEQPERVVVLGTLAAGREAARSPGGGSWLTGRLRRRARTLPTSSEPEAVPTTRVTVIDPVSLSAESQARAWLEELDREREVGAAARIVNRVVHTHRIAAADPYAHEVSPAQALVVRAGWGAGEQVADGHWMHARALPWPRHARSPRGTRGGPQRDRSAVLRPQERLAALLGARGAALLCEELVLRAREDLDHERLEHAALELEQAYALALVELHGEGRQDLALRLAELERLQAGVRAQAQATHARAAGGREERLDEELLLHALERLEATLRARTAAGVTS